MVLSAMMLAIETTGKTPLEVALIVAEQHPSLMATKNCN